MELITSVRAFTEAIGCSTTHFNARQTALYTGLQLEELAEKLEAIAAKPDSAVFGISLLSLVILLNDTSAEFKRGRFDHMIDRADRSSLLDADVDLAWVTIGSALSQGANIEGACSEVARANMAKLFQCGMCQGTGTALITPDSCTYCNGSGLISVKDENGKVRKPVDWKAPDIGPFVCKE